MNRFNEKLKYETRLVEGKEKKGNNKNNQQNDIVKKENATQVRKWTKHVMRTRRENGKERRQAIKEQLMGEI